MKFLFLQIILLHYLLFIKPEPSFTTYTFLNITDSLLYINDIKKAVTLYSTNIDSSELILTKVISETQEKGLKEIVFRAKLNLSTCYEIQDNFAKSDSLLIEIKKELGDNPDNKLVIDFYDRFSIYVNNIGYIDSALCILGKSIELSKKTNYYRINDIYKRFSGIYHNSGQLDSAIQYLLKAKDNTPANDTLELIDLDCRIGMIYENLIYTEKSLEYYSEALKKTEAIGKINIDVLYGMGMGNFQLCNYETAYRYFEKIINECGENWTYRYVPLNSFLHYWRCSVKLNKSHHYKSGMEFISKTNPILNTKRKGYIGIMQSEIYMHYGKFKNAESVLLDCLDFMKEIEKSGLIIDHYSRLSLVYEKLGDFSNALKYHKLYKEAYDIERSDRVQSEIVQLQEKYEAAERETKINELTNQFEKEKLESRLSKSKYRFTFIIATIFIALVFATSLYIRNHQKLNIIKLQAENKNKEHEIQNILEQSKTNILRSNLDGQEKERSRLAKELHDDLGGRITALRYFISSQQGLLDQESENALKAELKEIQQYIRNLSHKLAKPQFANVSLPQLIEEQKYWTNNHNIDFIFDFDSKIDWQRVPEAHQNEMYRIVQESVSNTFKHAQANKITIEIKNTSDCIHLVVSDNGTGIQNEKRQGTGLRNMEERAKLIGADFKIHSEYLNGTKISITYSLS